MTTTEPAGTIDHPTVIDGWKVWRTISFGKTEDVEMREMEGSKQDASLSSEELWIPTKGSRTIPTPVLAEAFRLLHLPA